MSTYYHVTIAAFVSLWLATSGWAASSRTIFVTPGGQINGQTVDSSDDIIVVSPGEVLSGTIQIVNDHDWEDAAIVPIGAAATWGDRESQFWTVASDSQSTPTQYVVDVNVTAPTTPGFYYILVAHGARYTAEQVMSGTTAALPPVWHDGNDLGWDWTYAQFSSVALQGFVINKILNSKGEYVLQEAGATCVRIQVEQNCHSDIVPDGTIDVFDLFQLLADWGKCQ